MYVSVCKYMYGVVGSHGGQNRASHSPILDMGAGTQIQSTLGVSGALNY